jgi:hypothetical protein
VNWRRHLSREIVTLKGDWLRTLHNARAYVLSIKGGRERHEYWQRTASLLL